MRLPGASQIDILVAPCHACSLHYVPQSILAEWTGSMYLTSSPHNLLELFMVLSQDLLLDYDLLQRLSVLLPSSFSTFFLLVPLLIDSVLLSLPLSVLTLHSKLFDASQSLTPTVFWVENVSVLVVPRESVKGPVLSKLLVLHPSSWTFLEQRRTLT